MQPPLLCVLGTPPPSVDFIQVWSPPKGEVEGCGVIERKGDDVDLTLIIIVVLAVVIAILLCLVIGLCVYCCKKWVQKMIQLQGDHSGCFKPPFDTKTMVVF